jgi:hypothetical protein
VTDDADAPKDVAALLASVRHAHAQAAGDSELMAKTLSEQFGGPVVRDVTTAFGPPPARAAEAPADPPEAELR